jgi:hypothetical protein
MRKMKCNKMGVCRLEPSRLSRQYGTGGLKVLPMQYLVALGSAKGTVGRKRSTKRKQTGKGGRKSKRLSRKKSVKQSGKGKKLGSRKKKAKRSGRPKTKATRRKKSKSSPKNKSK